VLELNGRTLPEGTFGGLITSKVLHHHFLVYEKEARKSYKGDASASELACAVFTKQFKTQCLPSMTSDTHRWKLYPEQVQKEHLQLMSQELNPRTCLIPVQPEAPERVQGLQIATLAECKQEFGALTCVAVGLSAGESAPKVSADSEPTEKLH